ncbi:MAG: GrpB family protein [bacterium]|nr:GrpB family protein [bacterium]
MKYIFKPYSSVFTPLFESQKIKLQEHLERDVVIEHIGSTAVPDLGGKGIIDIMVGIPKGKYLFPEIIKKLEKAGWEHREKADSLERIFFRKDLSDKTDGIRRYHLHLTYLNGRDWKETINFRNKLINNPAMRKAYEYLKKEAVKNANEDGEVYRKLKEPFINKFSK